MKPFKSLMASRLEEYVTYRKNLGYTDENVRAGLLHFDRYLQETKADGDNLRPSFFLDLRESLKGDPRTVNGILCQVRGFFQFLARLGAYRDNPLEDIPPRPERAYIPFVFSPEETEELLIVIQKGLRRTPECFLKDLAACLAILMYVRCGLRISEPLRLMRAGFRSEEGTIYIEKTKFNKDRLIPVPNSLKMEIENYLALRDALLPEDQNPYLLAADKQKGLNDSRVSFVFRQAVKDIGLDQPRRIIANTTFGRPVVHSLRHSFAINTLRRIREEGRSPQDALPVLAAYMGHRKYRYTSLYLKVLDAEQRKNLVDFAIGRQEEI